MKNYDFKSIESKWRKYWIENETYKTTEEGNKPKFYILDMFPYPSGEGLHVGHPKGYIATDIIARKKMMEGYNVLHPMGWDAFGLPAENYAIKNKVHPRVAVEKNVARYKEQLESIGFSYDWSREINTTDPEYYKWTQWIFLKLYNHYYDEKENKALPIEKLFVPSGLTAEDKDKFINSKRLAYVDYSPINWCPSCMTGLANEDLEDGKCERCGSEIERKPMRQWVLRITKYADRMLEDLNSLPEWEQSIVEMQRNWIGKSTGVEFRMNISGLDDYFEVYTTRIDTVFGMTFVVLAPEHPLIKKLESKINNIDVVNEYISNSKKKTDLQRTDLNKDKTGVRLDGIMAINPFNNKEVPVFIGDYVLANYGTGAVMAVPAHDERDFEFAKKYDLEIIQSVKEVLVDRKGDGAFREDKPLVERDTVGAIILHPTEDKFLVLKWKGFNWNTFVIGGVENGEDPIDAIKREITEETGFTNFKSVEKMLLEQISYFYAAHKGVSRKANESCYIIKLNDLTQLQISEEESLKHALEWIDIKDMLSTINTGGHIRFANYFVNPGAFTEDGVLTNSEKFDGLTSEKAREEMGKWIEEKCIGKRKTNYKLQEWVFSRQRYWGEPIPMIHCEKCGVVPLKESDLPLILPEVEKYEPTGTEEGPLANISEWINVKCPLCGIPAKRESNTMPQWAGSSWYWLRYMDNANDNSLVSKENEKYWNEVDVYVGGAEHATRHLIYARFWHKFLYDIGAVSTKEPFKKLQHVGLILAEDGRKMSKRWLNVINPDDVIKDFGADSMRLYESFMGPFAQEVSWSTSGVSGVKKFLDKVVKLSEKITAGYNDDEKIEILLNKTIKKITEDIDDFKFNTSVSAMMILVNEWSNYEKVGKDNFLAFVKLLSPFVPHLSEELWVEEGNVDSIFKSTWPTYNPNKLVDKVIKIAIQVNGKVRDEIEVEFDSSEEIVKQKAFESENMKKYTEGVEIKKIVYVKNKLLSIVI